MSALAYELPVTELGAMMRRLEREPWTWIYFVIRGEWFTPTPELVRFARHPAFAQDAP